MIIKIFNNVCQNVERVGHVITGVQIEELQHYCHTCLAKDVLRYVLKYTPCDILLTGLDGVGSFLQRLHTDGVACFGRRHVEHSSLVGGTVGDVQDRRGL